MSRYGLWWRLGVALLLLEACGGKSQVDTSAGRQGGGSSGVAEGGAAVVVVVGAAGEPGSDGGTAGAPSAATEGGDAGSAPSASQAGAAGAAGAAPVCDRGEVPDGADCTPPSCAGLAKTCGPNGREDCCTSPAVTGIGSPTFFRSFDGAAYKSQADPAQVSDFRLDSYEITVGRFRLFAHAYSRTMIAEGVGRNPNNPQDTGWSSTWNANLEADSGALGEALKCLEPFQTWTDQPGSAAAESLPINCLSWYEAEAFCIWDGGRLPTEAEWNYAAAGGTEQRAYPWGNQLPDCSFANYSGAAAGSEFCVQPPNGATNRVGSESPKGDGRFGQADLAGNVWEWVQDVHAAHYPNPCLDCASLTPGPARAVRGGSMFDGASGLLTSLRSNSPPLERDVEVGARCARSP